MVYGKLNEKRGTFDVSYRNAVIGILRGAFPESLFFHVNLLYIGRNGSCVGKYIGKSQFAQGIKGESHMDNVEKVIDKICDRLCTDLQKDDSYEVMYDMPEMVNALAKLINAKHACLLRELELKNRRRIGKGKGTHAFS